MLRPVRYVLQRMVYRAGDPGKPNLHDGQRHRRNRGARTPIQADRSALGTDGFCEVFFASDMD